VGGRYANKYRGVNHVPGEKGYTVRLHVKGANKYVGNRSDEVEAATLYDQSAVANKGLKAKTNFPLSNYLDFLGAFPPRCFDTR
jgi:hypothetical protein